MFTYPQNLTFWNNVDRREKDECWNWKIALDKHGYGKAKIGGKFRLAHRAAYEMANLEINRDKSVLHSCDNPKCCNPYHLFQGTHLENMKDMVAKKRNAHNRTKRKLTQELATAIRIDFYRGAPKLFLGRKYGVSPSTIRSVISRETWNHDLPDKKHSR